MRLFVLLLTVCVALGVTVAYQMREDAGKAASGPKAANGAAAVKVPLLPRIAYRGMDDYRGVVEDNLFSPDRRPPEKTDGATAPSGPQLPIGAPRFELKGVLITPQGRSALVQLPRETDYRRVIPGGVIEGWTVEAIAADGITVKKGGETAVVRLKASKPSKPIVKQRRRPSRPGIRRDRN